VEAFAPLEFGALDRTGVVIRVLTVGALLGLLFWVIDRATLGGRLRHLPYGRLIALQVALRAFVLVLLMAVVRFSGFTRSGETFDAGLWLSRVFSVNTLVILAYGTVVAGVFAFLREADRKFGPGNLWRMLRGRYYRPREEQRTFAFLDLQASTTLAERLGHVTYSSLVQDCFRDLGVVAADRAEVYQYVGDEAVLCWEGESGLTDAACLKACFRFFDRLESRRSHYEQAYGALPVFKAGLNAGTVSVAEVGEIKREIAYHGDVLNTAARTQAKCNEYGESVLITEDLRSALGELAGYDLERMGEVELRGKQQTVALHAVRRAEG
jgi:adenylate cyclase